MRSYTNLSAGFAPIRFVVKSMYVGISARAGGCNISQKCLGYPSGRDVSFGVINMSKLVRFFCLVKNLLRGERELRDGARSDARCGGGHWRRIET